MVVPVDSPSDTLAAPAAPVAVPGSHARARPVLVLLTGLGAVVTLACAATASDLAVVLLGAALTLGLAATAGALAASSLLARDAPPAASGAAVPDATRATPPAQTTRATPAPEAAPPALRAELDRMERRQQRDLAQRLHDGPLQLVIAALQDVTDLREGEDVSLTELEMTLREAIGGMRETASDLYDDVVRDAGLAAALGQVAKTIERAGGPTVDVAVAGETSSAHDALVVAATRELLTNVRKHARATHALVVVERTPDGLLRLLVDDDGIGFGDDARRDAAARGHLGLRSIEDRARRDGGRLIASSAGTGSVVQVLLPMDDAGRELLARRGALRTAARPASATGRLIGA